MINSSDQRYLIDVLIDIIAPANDPRAVLVLAVSDPQFAANLTLGPTPVVLAQHALQLCIATAWTRNPPWLILLLDSPLVAWRPDDNRLQRIRASLVPPPPGAANPLLATLLNRGTPFMNRTRLRANLQQLDTMAGLQQPILVINGNAKSGKSYSSRYVEHFARLCTPGLFIHRFEFKPHLALSLGPEQLAQDLVSSLGRPQTNKPTPDTNLKLYVRQLAAWILSEAVQTHDRHWFVLDGFVNDARRAETEQPRLDTLEMLVELSDLVTSGSYVNNCRLILTGFDRAMLTVDPGKVKVERIAPCSRADVELCRHEILAQAHFPADQAQADAFLFGRLPASPDELPELNARLRALFMAVAGLNDLSPPPDAAEYAGLFGTLLAGLPHRPQRMALLEELLDALQESQLGAPERMALLEKLLAVLHDQPLEPQS